MLHRRIMSIALAAAVAGGCSGDASVTWVLRFRSPEVAARATWVRATLLRGDCASTEPLYSAQVPLDGSPTGTPAPRALAPGDYAFVGEARDAGCAIIARGCVPVRLGGGEDRRVEVLLEELAPPVPACTPASCLGGGRCETGGTRDAGADATTPLDAGPGPGDAGDVDGGPRPLALGTGDSHTCARRRTGAVACLGRNERGQLGQATTGDGGVDAPADVAGLAGVAQLALGEDHSCARLASGRVLCWGWGDEGQLGDGAGVSRSLPVAVEGLADAVDLGAGGRHTCAVRRDGRVSCWGRNRPPALGNGTVGGVELRPVDALGIGDAVQVVAGAGHTCALHRTGRVSCWGGNRWGNVPGSAGSEADRPVDTGIDDALRLAAGSDHTCVLHRDGTLSCWGRNDEGQLGVASAITQTSVPMRVPTLTDVVAVAAGRNATCAVLAGGAVRCWGANDRGQLGIDADPSVRLAPSAPVVDLSSAVMLSLGAGFACARLADGGLSCWGRNSYGQLGARAGVGDDFRPAPVDGL